MPVVTILGISMAALAALLAYNRGQRINPEVTDQRVKGVQRSTSVVLSIANAIHNVIEALVSLTAPSSARSIPTTSRRFASSED